MERVSKMESGRTGRGSLYLSIVRDMVNETGVLTDARLARGRTCYARTLRKQYACSLYGYGSVESGCPFWDP